jgi:hypothetical protein
VKLYSNHNDKNGLFTGPAAPNVSYTGLQSARVKLCLCPLRLLRWLLLF